MAYKVIITPVAKRHLDRYVEYTLQVLQNPDAARGIIKDAKETKKRLSTVAGALKLCDNPILAKYDYRTIRFAHHNYFMVYRIDGNTVIVDAMYHDLQDYESVFIRNMHLN